MALLSETKLFTFVEIALALLTLLSVLPDLLQLPGWLAVCTTYCMLRLLCCL